MLAALGDDHQRVLIAHERAHLRGGHHWLTLAVDLSAAVNPMLTRMRRIAGYLCERAADEHAAAETGDRRMVADSIALAALARSGRVAPGTTGLAFHHLGTVERVAALHQPAPATSRLWTWAALVVGAIVAADVNATDELVEVLRRLV
jgi:beta-lactamase regulating signal transducer with metallopeptidase domain